MPVPQPYGVDSADVSAGFSSRAATSNSTASPSRTATTRPHQPSGLDSQARSNPGTHPRAPSDAKMWRPSA